MTFSTNNPEAEEQPQAYDAATLKPARKRKQSPSSSQPPMKRARSGSPSASPASKDQPRKLKRPGQRARISEADREQLRLKQSLREKEQEAALASNTIHEAVRSHYNAVPERGREWRVTQSRIKGLRSFNNWIKNSIIQKFSPNENYTPGAQEFGGQRFAEGQSKLLVLDIGCGKGGDLFKWQQAPQQVDLVVGLDPADVSIDQAKDRYRSMREPGRSGRGGRGGYSNRQQPPIFTGEFHVKDCFGESIETLPIIRQVGFDSSGGPSRFGGGGFDVVSMMFCLHYAFESQQKAHQMLRNVAGALKKGGRLIGCIPHSDVLSEKVIAFNKLSSEGKNTRAASDEEDGEVEEGEAEETASFGNDVYRVRFPGKTPADGVFRPPFGWKYSYFLHEAVEEVPEYVVPWEAFRAIAEEYNLEMQYHKSFDQIWNSEKDDPILGPLSERMGVKDRSTGKLLISDEEMEAASFYAAFCFYKV